ncbi:DUF2691 family protein [Chryseobacterium sp. SSA4.19]|uniref:DUF2691 family protein n=1 Tax=Chryseobacterium sp. SSA4.19 TaxID=2919915 RepID=UPI001F4DF7C7|nr:DUF2691 family protein [Chryseobacterium sp. SSA4.19]MCJ8155647.1 DUF2691 family protein [Chryseobacterium sp. SSA4.19]
MNWIISRTKISFHTHLFEILKPIWKDLSECNWVLTDLDFMSDNEIPINFDHDYFIFNREEFEKLYQSHTQMIWGIISAVPQGISLNEKIISTLSAEDARVWESDEFLIPESIVEIIAFDSSYTIVKFKDEKLSNMFKEYFQKEAVDLQKFNDKYIR